MLFLITCETIRRGFQSATAAAFLGGVTFRHLQCLVGNTYCVKTRSTVRTQAGVCSPTDMKSCIMVLYHLYITQYYWQAFLFCLEVSMTIILHDCNFLPMEWNMIWYEEGKWEAGTTFPLV